MARHSPTGSLSRIDPFYRTCRPSGVVTVGPHTAVGLVFAVHWLATQRTSRTPRGDHLGDVATQRPQLLARRPRSEGGSLGWLFFLRTARLNVVHQEHIARSAFELALVLAERQSTNLEVDGRIGRKAFDRRLVGRLRGEVALKLSQQLLDSQPERLQLLFFDPQRRSPAVVTFDQQAEG